MKIINCVQGSSEWFGVRCGIVTASEIDALVTPEFKARTGGGVKTYLYQKVAEKIMGYSQGELHGTPSWAADQGKLLEGEAIPWLEFQHNLKVERVGFCVSDDGLTGCSPDGLIGEDEGVEIKCPLASQQIRYLTDNALPKQYVTQVHFSMLVTGRKAWRFVSYHRHLPKLMLRIERDKAIIEKMTATVSAFLSDFDCTLTRIRELMEP